MPKYLATAAALVLLHASAPAAEPTGFVEHITARTDGSIVTPARIKPHGLISTKAKFKPPVEIIIEAKTDNNNLRLGYAADQMIFNWEVNRNELRIDGGPAHGQHKSGSGMIPTKQYVTVRWISPRRSKRST